MKRLIIKKHKFKNGFVVIRKCKNGLYQVRFFLEGEGTTMHFKDIKKAINEFYDTIRFVHIVLSNNIK